MAKNSFKSNSAKEKEQKSGFKMPSFNLSFLKERKTQLVIGYVFLLASFYFLIAFTSYIFTGKADQSIFQAIPEIGVREGGKEVENWLGLVGAWISNLFIYEWFGIASFGFVPLFFVYGVKMVYEKDLLDIKWFTKSLMFVVLWLSIMLGYLIFITDSADTIGFLCGGVGFETASFISGIIGWGTLPFMLFLAILFVIFAFNVTSLGSAAVTIPDDEKKQEAQNLLKNDEVPNPFEGENLDEEKEDDIAPEEVEFIVNNKGEEPLIDEDFTGDEEVEFQKKNDEIILEIEESVEEEKISSIQHTLTNYDPTLDLSKYQYPTIDLLEPHGDGKGKVTREELEANQKKIIETLQNYKIGIAHIKATVGPTVTLYEIVPEAGVRISKIKNLEDDIALSLSALGIRIIAPIPGKGTIGIEVPNTTKEVVSMQSVISTEKFAKAEMDLPIALGKTISNEVFITDLTKMPHLLMAGATGQGKSVGLNCILASLLYKKHPSQVKFVLVDPKKVELTLYGKIERHFLAKLPDGEEAIITDTSKVIKTLNSLCVEMDTRYDLLKEAGCRNLNEYNKKFLSRQLNPEQGHKFLPFIVLVIDELADLMITAGREVETPIARLAQLARAIGIHLILATQRPSVNVITGVIKANFPARLSFRVTSKIDSRTILDAGGAEQLIGKGDMLLSVGSDLIRIQCAFLDTPEVQKICDFIGEQQGYAHAYHLPEVADDESGSGGVDVNLSERDPMFEQAAQVVVNAQQGSTSLIQRKLKLGYNRAGRIMDQLEAAGIVGPFEGSKAREVLIPDSYSLEQKLREIDENN